MKINKNKIGTSIIALFLLTSIVSLMPLFNAGETTEYFFRFDDYSVNQSWSFYPQYMVDGSIYTFAYTNATAETQLCTRNNCNLNNTSINSVKIRLYAYASQGGQRMRIIPVFNGTTDGESYYFNNIPTTPNWTEWADITNDVYGPGNWTNWDIINLDCKVKTGVTLLKTTFYCSYVQIKVEIN
jgi:hypothetical protein